ncbi:MAG TPA: HAMP domain-containing sensor histidine kinase [Melioribacteraceae bacterium]|mgnify:CR=1 FL=1|nr:HAMP domain-containing sensor histidine kinase [Melioribacteraceae bacterium]
MSSDIQNNKLQILGKLAASLAHEIRNPLSALKLNLDYLNLSKNELSNDLIESIEACKEATERIQIIMENTLDFARKSHHESDEFSILELYNRAIILLEGSAKKKNIEILLNHGNNLPLLNIDKNKIIQVIVNLINNAIDASYNNSKIDVNINCEENFVVFSVQDYGIGIKDEDKPKIYNDFYTNKETGTGLGLSVCRSILKEFNAELSFESKEEKGSRFYVKFPLK